MIGPWGLWHPCIFQQFAAACPVPLCSKDLDKLYILSNFSLSIESAQTSFSMGVLNAVVGCEACSSREYIFNLVFSFVVQMSVLQSEIAEVGIGFPFSWKLIMSIAVGMLTSAIAEEAVLWQMLKGFIGYSAFWGRRGWGAAGHSCSASWSADNQHMVLYA